MPEQEAPVNAPLDSARDRRASLKAALSAVEIAAASPAAEDGWRDELVAALRKLRQALDEHVDEVEGEGGLFEALMQDAPHLCSQIATVRNEHPELADHIDATISDAANAATPRDVRDSVLATLAAIARHRQHGADLVYQAYMVDIGSGD